jgi:hypothetical protein
VGAHDGLLGRLGELIRILQERIELGGRGGFWCRKVECCIWGGRGEEEVEAMKVVGKARKRIVDLDLEFDVEQEGILRARSRRKKPFQE